METIGGQAVILLSLLLTVCGVLLVALQVKRAMAKKAINDDVNAPEVNEAILYTLISIDTVDLLAMLVKFFYNRACNKATKGEGYEDVSTCTQGGYAWVGRCVGGWVHGDAATAMGGWGG
jgi:hypothetical protein